MNDEIIRRLEESFTRDDLVKTVEQTISFTRDNLVKTVEQTITATLTSPMVGYTASSGYPPRPVEQTIQATVTPATVGYTPGSGSPESVK
jgi:hypothetical protein